MEQLSGRKRGKLLAPASAIRNPAATATTAVSAIAVGAPSSVRNGRAARCPERLDRCVPEREPEDEPDDDQPDDELEDVRRAEPQEEAANRRPRAPRREEHGEHCHSCDQRRDGELTEGKACDLGKAREEASRAGGRLLWEERRSRCHGSLAEERPSLLRTMVADLARIRSGVRWSGGLTVRARRRRLTSLLGALRAR